MLMPWSEWISFTSSVSIKISGPSGLCSGLANVSNVVSSVGHCLNKDSVLNVSLLISDSLGGDDCAVLIFQRMVLAYDEELGS